MKKKCIAQSGFFPLRVSFTLLLWAVASWILGTTVLGFFRAEAPRRVSETRLTFAERVAYQRAIENVYWRHRIWPKERPDPKPSPDAVISASTDTGSCGLLRNQQALEDSGNDQSLLSNYRVRWIAWHAIPGSPRCYVNFLKRSGTIPSSSRNVSRGRC
jgi:hypothetical protein